MAYGRCAGDGETGELKAVTSHVLRCPAWAALYRADPARALTPAGEYDRWAAKEQAAEKAARHDVVVGDTQRRRDVQADRFRTRDPLEDE